MRNRALIAAAVVLAAATAIGILVSWHRNAVPAHGPLGDGGDAGIVCFGHLTPKQPVTIGSEVIANRGSSEVTIDALDLSGANGLDFLGAVLVPIAKNNSVGVQHGYPPSTKDLAAGVLWDLRQNVVGAVLPPNSEVIGSTGVFSLAVGLEKSGTADGALEQFVLKYHTDTGKHYTLSTHDGVKLVAIGCDTNASPGASSP